MIINITAIMAKLVDPCSYVGLKILTLPYYVAAQYPLVVVIAQF